MSFLRELRVQNVARASESFGQKDGFSALYYSNAAAGEMGEVCNVIKKLTRAHLEKDKVITEVDLGYEIADVIIYLDLLADRFGIDLEEVICEKFNIVSARVNSPRRI